MAKFKITVSSLVTETYEIEADDAESAEDVMWEGAQPTDTEWNDAEVLDVTLIEEKRWEHWVRPEGIDTLEELGFRDTTYTNDACPSWTHDDLDLQIFVDLPIPYSEAQDTPTDYKQYLIFTASQYGEQDAHILSTNDFAEVIAHIQNLGE